MEYFRVVPIKTTESEIQNFVDFSQLERINSQMFCLEEISERECIVATIWGEFTLIRENIKGGVRLALQDCPNALAWTLTTGYSPDPNALVVHLTINRTRKKPEFIEELKEFLDDTEESLLIREINLEKV